MRQFVLPPDWDGGPRCAVSGERARQLLRVLRLGPGDGFPGLDAAGRRHDCEILEAGPSGILLSVGPARGPEPPDRPLPDRRGGADPKRARPPAPHGGARGGEAPAAVAPDAPAGAAPRTAPRTAPSPAPPFPRIVLAQAILKGERMDLVLRQAAEAGVAELIPLLTERCVAREGGAARRERWDRVVREALQQSGSPVPTRIAEPLDIPGLLAAAAPLSPAGAEGGRLGLLLHEAPLAEASLHRYLDGAPGEILLCVGPEGGFSAEEAGTLRGAGFLPLRLPGAVLRAETAALYAVAAVEIIVSERSSWIRLP